MRLINATTLKLEEFVNHEQAPPYAILSHTWGDEEVTFQDMADLETARKKAGFAKIKHCCRRALYEGWDWVWDDTCCIDKTSSAELSESINSMFLWYEAAEVCYAYLADVPPLSSYPSDQKHRQRLDFVSSRWFTRGWTLQELLAPAFLEFFDSGWGMIGSREQWADDIEKATGIEVDQLAIFQQCSVATKLSWAANRETTRIEDRAYSLLGLLGVNMPLIYGEGKLAFIRLQHELTRYFNDESIFAWGFPLESGIPAVFGENTNPAGGRSYRDTLVFAPSPQEFASSRGIVPSMMDQQPRLFQMTNAGLSIKAEVFKLPEDALNADWLYFIQLNCSWSRDRPPVQTDTDPAGLVALFLRDALPPANNNNINNDNSNSGQVPVFFTKVGCSLLNPQDAGKWQSLGKHTILIAAQGPAESADEKMEVNIRFQPYGLHSADGRATRFDHAYYLGRRHRRTGQWDITRTQRPPTTIAEHEAFICIVTAEGRSNGRSFGYLAIVKWNRFVRWNRWRPRPGPSRRGLTHGIWRVGGAGASSIYDEDMLKLKLDSDRVHRYPNTAPGSLEFGSQSTGMYVSVTPRGNPARAGTRQFLVRLSRILHRPPPTYISDKQTQDRDSATTTTSSSSGSLPSEHLPIRNV